jgi:methylmalonyl-CoA epimerase
MRKGTPGVPDGPPVGASGAIFRQSHSSDEAMQLEHVGIAVRDAAATVEIFEKLLGARPYKAEEVASESVRTLFIDAGGPRIELLEATDEGSAIARHIASRGEGLHHLAFEVPDIDGAHARLAAAGFRLLNPQPKRGADDKRIFFVHPRDGGGVLVELCQTDAAPLAPSLAAEPDGRVAYYVHGRDDAPPLVMLHGAMGSTAMETRRLTRHLETNFRTVSVDFAGHGASDAFDGHGLSIELFAGNVLAVLDELAIERAHVFGFSLGAAVALYLAHHHRQRVDGLALHGANVQWDVREAQAMIQAMRPEIVERAKPRWAAWLAEAHGEPGWRDLAARMIRFTEHLPANHFLDDDLAGIETPTLVSHGDSDRFFRLDHALHLHRTIPGARLAVHPGIDHPIQKVDASGFARMLALFFGEL